ncbi:hypothetical protein SAMD00079811_54770 [Scytonema sp. HK-05]|nr:hypothetical protein NIES2130_07700 [Scytonema sp. HK-05]BAY47858.1 hypothetical protein SAMD00079811_54770 [Scytonema sp. HK-05]
MIFRTKVEALQQQEESLFGQCASPHPRLLVPYRSKITYSDLLLSLCQRTLSKGGGNLPSGSPVAWVGKPSCSTGLTARKSPPLLPRAVKK